jgi:hypothetical protein
MKGDKIKAKKYWIMDIVGICITAISLVLGGCPGGLPGDTERLMDLNRRMGVPEESGVIDTLYF